MKKIMINILFVIYLILTIGFWLITIVAISRMFDNNYNLDLQIWTAILGSLLGTYFTFSLRNIKREKEFLNY